MEPIGEVLVGLVILVGLVGIVVPVLPGLLLIVAAIAVWALVTATGPAWAIAIGAIVVGAGSQVLKYTIPGRRLRDQGVPRSTLYAAGLLAIVGFFVIPVVGGIIGFVLGTYLAEYRRLGSEAAWPATKRSLAAVGLAIGIELVAGLSIAAAWLAAAIWLT